MASAEIDSGICGFCTTVRTSMEGRAVRLEFETTCGYVEKLAEQLTEVDPYREISYRGEAQGHGPLAAVADLTVRIDLGELLGQLLHVAAGGLELEPHGVALHAGADGRAEAADAAVDLG